MKAADCVKLEKSYTFKKSYLLKTYWWKTLLMVPPICLLFVGLVGIMYLFNHQMLASWYVAPYIILFTIGTVMLKAMRRHIIRTEVAKDGAYLVCLAQSIGEQKGYTYSLFARNSRRHDKNNIDNIVRNTDCEDIINKYALQAQKESVCINGENDNTFYLRAFKTKELDKYNKKWTESSCFPILYINSKDTVIIKGRDITEFID